MYTNNLFIKFCKDRNINENTKKGYVSTLKLYTKFHNESLEYLINEAIMEENKSIPLKNRKIRERLLSFRNYLFKMNFTTNTIKTYFSKLKTFYIHHEIQIPTLPLVSYEREYETNYKDLPTKNDIKCALESCDLGFKALILFMSSSGTAKAETLSLTVKDFIDATDEYHSNGNIKDILQELKIRKDIIPILYLQRLKTKKYYYNFCSPEATNYIVKYLISRENLTLNDNLFPFSDSYVISTFQKINDDNEWGFKGKFRFFRSHTLRKFHASNLGLEAEYIDALQGRSKNPIHETYIKTNPEKLKRKYERVLKNITIYEDAIVHEDSFDENNITINLFISNFNYYMS